jgi:hypothetical protein
MKSRNINALVGKTIIHLDFSGIGKSIAIHPSLMQNVLNWQSLETT